MRHETFSTPGPVALDIRIPAGDIEIETDDASETVVELQARGRDPELLEQDAEISMRPRGEGYEVRVEAGNGRGGLSAAGAASIACASRRPMARRCAHSSPPRTSGPRKLCVPRHQGRIGRRRVRGRVRRGRRQQRLGRRPVRERRHGEGQLGLRRRPDRPGGRRGRGQHRVGDAEIRSAVAGDVRLNSASGDIEVGIAKGSRLWVDAQTLSGDTSSELDLESGGTPETDDGPLVELKARSMSGDISIKRA